MKRLISGILTGVLVFSMPVLSVLQTRASEQNGDISAITSESLTYSTNSEHVGAEIWKAFDGNCNTFWDSAWMEGDKGLGITPIVIDVQFNSPKDIKKFVYTPRQDDNPNGQILKYSLSGTTTSGEEVVLVAYGEWADNHSDKEVTINQEERLVSVKMTITEGSF